ncbi:hypothetical protein [Xanthobacter autotrophicus]|uniref:hypothetical protein n=1 Tax=Xanthobacter autotrophicus TaxID=280 RepID=UPI003729BDCC
MRGGLEWVRSSYGVPARRGGRVEYTGKGKSQMGTITGASGSHILIRLDEVGFPQPFHPTWSLRYLDATPVTVAKSEVPSIRGRSGAVIIDDLESASPPQEGEV